jgi:hypothetical protein
MTAKDESAIGVALKRRPGVPGSIEVVFYWKIFQLVLKPGARLEPGRTPGNTLSSIRVGRQSAKLVKIQDYPERINRHASPPEEDRLLRLLDEYRF